MIDCLPASSTVQERIEAYSIPEPNSGCWLWLATISKGYGILHINGKRTRAHRASYMAFKGPILQGYHVLHRCDTPSCVNPEHLWQGTQMENILDMFEKGRSPSRSGECGGRSKLSNDDVLTIVEVLRTTNTPMKQIADQYGIAANTLSQINIGATWAFLTGASRNNRLRPMKEKTI